MRIHVPLFLIRVSSQVLAQLDSFQMENVIHVLRELGNVLNVILLMRFKFFKQFALAARQDILSKRST